MPLRREAFFLSALPIPIRSLVSSLNIRPIGFMSGFIVS